MFSLFSEADNAFRSAETLDSLAPGRMFPELVEGVIIQRR